MRCLRVLLVEDEEDLARPLVGLLRRERYEVDWATTADQALDCMAQAEPDVVLMDVMLGHHEDAGFRLAGLLRESGYAKPILFLTARDSLEDRVRGLDLGADDYLTKPFEIAELMARLRALLRRESKTRRAVFERGPLRVDFATRRVYWNGADLTLTDREFGLLELLALSPDRVFRVEELLDQLFPTASSGQAILRIYISRLREKTDPAVIVTVPGGYRLGLSD